jgi:quercetin dioxygenase-like cupin family protein
MKNIPLYLFAGATIFLSACSRNQDIVAINSHIIFPRGKEITNDNFTGKAYLQMLVAADSLNSNTVGNVTFDPGARTNWHRHPGGQILLVTDGVGYYQEKGKTKKLLHKGDVIKCPPNVIHWHGASTDMALTHVAISSNEEGAAVWLDKVSDEEYLK